MTDKVAALSYRGPITISALDQEIARVHKYLKTLKDRRNELVMAFKLPTELVRHIFLLCMDVTSDEHLYNSKYGRSKSVWPGFSQMCRIWREIAIGYPALWTQPRFDRPRAAAEMLKRSARLSKKISAHCSSVNGADLGRRILREALDGSHGPVHALHLCMPRSMLSEVRSTVKPLQGSLKYLTLQQNGIIDRDSSDEDSSNESYIDVTGELDDIAEHLVGLRLVYIKEDFGLRFNSWPNLTQLVVECVFGPLALFSVLSTTPLLERLLIKELGDGEPCNDPDSDPEQSDLEDGQISLGKLVLLRISSSGISSMVRLLKNIELPSTVCVHIDQVEDAYNYNPQVIRRTGRLACRQIAVKHLTSEVRETTHTLVCRDEHLRTVARFTTNIGTWPSKTTIYFDTFDGLPLDEVESLVLRSDTEDGIGAGHLLMLPKLKRVAMIETHSVWAFVHADAPESIKDHSSQRPFKPILATPERTSLETVTVINTRFRPPSDSHHWANVHSTIDQYVLANRSNGASISTLILENTYEAERISSLFKGQGHSILRVTDHRARSLSALRLENGVEKSVEITPEEFSAYDWLYVKDDWSFKQYYMEIQESENWCLPP